MQCRIQSAPVWLLRIILAGADRRQVNSGLEQRLRATHDVCEVVLQVLFSFALSPVSPGEVEACEPQSNEDLGLDAIAELVGKGVGELVLSSSPTDRDSRAQCRVAGDHPYPRTEASVLVLWGGQGLCQQPDHGLGGPASIVVGQADSGGLEVGLGRRCRLDDDVFLRLEVAEEGRARDAHDLSQLLDRHALVSMLDQMVERNVSEFTSQCVSGPTPGIDIHEIQSSL